MNAMDFRIADTFTDSLARLNGDEQKAAKMTAFDLQLNPASPGLSFHKLDRAKDKNFWSVRVNRDVRLIVHRTEKSLLLCYVDHHDDAYQWAERRKIERHPKTGAAQIVEFRELVREIEIPKYVEAETPQRARARLLVKPRSPEPSPPKPPLFKSVDDDQLLGYGVPEEWLEDVRTATEDSLLAVADHLPQEAAEALLELATGGTPEPARAIAEDVDSFAHPDAQRRFRQMTDSEELRKALEYPWEKWTVFLHPAQRDLVERSFSGPARVAGSAGTGKTIVALHRAVELARRNADAMVLLTTFSIPLARLLRRKLERLAGEDQDLHARVVVRAIDQVGIEFYEAEHGTPRIPTDGMVRTLLRNASEEVGDHRFSLRFLETEWADVVDAWQLDSWEAYRDVARLGRKTRLGEKQRGTLWSIFEKVRSNLAEQGFVTMAGVFAAGARRLEEGAEPPADFAVVDEAQDISVPQLRFLAAMAGEREDGLFFSGDLGQRIFQTPFSWKSLGVDVRGRSRTLRLNYRTSHQIRSQADRLLPPDVTDVDGNIESRRGTVSAFNGPEPVVLEVESVEKEAETVAHWLSTRINDGLGSGELAVFVRSEAELPRACEAVKQAGLSLAILDGKAEPAADAVSVSTMHLAKGLEFRGVAVMACDDEIVPLQARIESVADEADLEVIYDTERHLFYVACTRARDHLLVSGVKPVSEFLDDFRV